MGEVTLEVDDALGEMEAEGDNVSFALEVVLATEYMLYEEALKDGKDEEEGRYETVEITEGFLEKVGDGDVIGDVVVILVLFVVALEAVELFVVLVSIPGGNWTTEVNSKLGSGVP